MSVGWILTSPTERNNELSNSLKMPIGDDGLCSKSNWAPKTCYIMLEWDMAPLPELWWNTPYFFPLIVIGPTPWELPLSLRSIAILSLHFLCLVCNQLTHCVLWLVNVCVGAWLALKIVALWGRLGSIYVPQPVCIRDTEGLHEL